MPNTDDKAPRRLMFVLWANWTLTALAFILVLILPLLINKLITPLVVIAIAYGLLVYSRRMQQAQEPYCVLTIRYGVLVLFWTSIAMMLILFINKFGIFHKLLTINSINPTIPYIVCLILSPLMVIVAVWHLILGQKSRFCSACRARTGHTADLNVMSALYSREARYQLKMFILFGAGLSVLQWWYYFEYYINININRQDLFVFNLTPIGVMMFSSILMLMRYTNMASVIGPLIKAQQNQSIVRFLVLSDDYLLLKENAHGRWDTPINIYIDQQMHLDNDIAKSLFKEHVGIDTVELKYLYSNKTHDNKSEIIHYAAIVNSKDRHYFKDGIWNTLDKIQRYLNGALLTAELGNEIFRIYTITMAWKTYNRQGHRLYPIKHYRPTFRLRDFKKWNVEYDDLSWLSVATNNQDRPFFHIRKLWHRITGFSR